MSESQNEVIVIPGVGDVSAESLWVKVGVPLLSVPGEQAGPIVRQIIEAGQLTIEENVLLVLIAVESLSSSTFMRGDLPHAR